MPRQFSKKSKTTQASNVSKNQSQDEATFLNQEQLVSTIQKEIRNSKLFSESKEKGALNPEKHINLECGYCHKIGHIKRNCYKLAYARQQAIKSSKETKDTGDPASDSDSKWYVDSAFTKHIVNNKTNYIFLDQTHQSQVEGLGYNKLKVLGIGVYQLEFIISTELNNIKKNRIKLNDVLLLKLI
jgi:hypothetical protein